MSSKSKQLIIKSSIVFFILAALGVFGQKILDVLRHGEPQSKVSKPANPSPAFDPQRMVKMRELIEQKSETLNKEYEKAGAKASEEWKQFGARLNLDLKSEFIHLDQAIKQQYGDDVPLALKDQRAVLDRYSNDLLFVWREMNSQIFKHHNQLSVAQKILRKTADDARVSLPSAPEPEQK